MKVKDVIERLSKLDPEDEVIIQWFDRFDIHSEFFGGNWVESWKIKDEDWKTIVTQQETRDRSYEEFYTEFSDLVYGVIGHHKCEQCETLDYDLKAVGDVGENLCKGCGEEEDEVY